MEVLEKKKNLLLGREEILLRVSSQITPSMQQAKEEVLKKFDIPDERVVVKKISGKFGSRNFDVKAYVYESAEMLKKIEPKIKEKKAAEKKEEKVEEKKAGEKPAEKK